jgi:hypothetical protein
MRRRCSGARGAGARRGCAAARAPRALRTKKYTRALYRSLAARATLPHFSPERGRSSPQRARGLARVCVTGARAMTTAADAQRDLSHSIADSVATQYASIMDALIAQATDLEAMLTATRADAARARADAARARADIVRLEGELAAARDGDVGDVDMRAYCEVCDAMWHRDYVTWFARAFVAGDGRHCSSACGRCFAQVPLGHQ